MPDFSWFSYSCSYLISEVARWEFFSFYFLVEKCSFCYFYVHMMVTKSRSCSFPFHMKMSWFPFDFWKFFLVGCKCPGWHVLFCSGSKKCFFRFWRSCGLCGVLFVWFVWPLWAKCNDKIPFSWAVLKICLFVFNFLHFGYSCYRYVLSGSYYAYVFFSFAYMFIFCLNWEGLKSLFVPAFFSALLFSFLPQNSNENYKLSSIISQVSCFPVLLFHLVLHSRSDLVKPTVLWPGSLICPYCPLSDVEFIRSIQLPFSFFFCL